MSDHAAALWQAVACRSNGPEYARRYAEQFERLAASGADVHGEAAFVAGLVPRGARVLDAGCGTGRVAARLHELGYAVVGVDADPAMVQVAGERWPELEWHVADLADLDLGRELDAVVLAGNVVPFVAAGALPSAVAAVARHLAPGGLLVAGFGLDAGHLPPGVPVVPLSAYDSACERAGLLLVERHGGWAREPLAGGYAVSVHRRSGAHDATARDESHNLADRRHGVLGSAS